MSTPKRSRRILSAGLLTISLLIAATFSDAFLPAREDLGAFWGSRALAANSNDHGNNGNGRGGEKDKSKNDPPGHDNGAGNHGHGSSGNASSGGSNGGNGGAGENGANGGGQGRGVDGGGQGQGGGGGGQGQGGGGGGQGQGANGGGQGQGANGSDQGQGTNGGGRVQTGGDAQSAPADEADEREPVAVEPTAFASELRSDRGGNDEVPGEIVVLDEDAAFFREVRRLGFRIIAQQPLGALGITITRLAVPGALTPTAAQNLLRERYPRVLTASNGLYRPQASLSLPPADYAGRLIGWGDPPPSCGSGIAIGLIDTDLAADHPAFAGRSIERRSFLAPAERPAAADHGTAVAGILVGAGAAGVPAGLLPGATLRVAETFLLDQAGQPAASVVGVVSALDWLIQTRTSVINLSLAGADNLLLSIAIERAVARGAVLVAAAGNDGPGGAAAYPAAYPDVVAVAALDRNLAPFGAGTHGDYIDLAAPGVEIAAAAPSGALSLVSGSSFAAPYVTAAVALRVAAGLPADAQSVHQALAEDARDLGEPGRDAVYGWGLLQTATACGATTDTAATSAASGGG